MALTKNVSIGRNYMHPIFLLSIFLEFFAGFVSCSLGLFNDCSKKKKTLSIFKIIMHYCVFTKYLELRHFYEASVAKFFTGVCTKWKTFFQERFKTFH